ncbi:PhnD/SsuA/transferrin family substrate-binding protein [Pseudanabaena sp. UWO310]|uniref:sensor histidine kinase n=1 Tax=Pseudanabaena sp. UWO310 TaxID=2480795 RepID=UPI00115B9402|nr:PhnD/SsuA/transferrin family substrate-binding protein [Pseudanabaena sp. UWO310]TYQ26268.1 PhnD/SsuA/transferrin family substrate-binding protein [Pseudanabaena sp. UWO310]
MNIQPNIPSSILLQPDPNNAVEAIAPQPTNKAFRIGVLARRGISRTLQLWQPTADYLSNQLGHTFTITPLDFKQINPSVANGEVDFIVANSSLYIEFETLYGIKRLATLKRARRGKDYTVFGGVIFRRSDRQDIQTLQDLIGKNFAGANEKSLGAWQAAWREFHALGIDPRRDFLSLQFTGTHDAVVYAVRDRLVDAGSVHTDTLEQMALEGKIHLEDFEIINQQTQYGEEFPFALSTRLYPELPFAACRQVNNDISEQVAIALFQMNKLAPEVALAANSQGWTIPLSYASVHECLRELRLGIYAGKNELDFDLAVQGSNNGWWDWNIENNQTFYSTRWKEMLGYAEDEIANNISEWEQRIHPDDRNLCLETLQNYLQGKIPEYQLEHRLQHKDGSYRWIISRGKILRDIHGQPYRMAGSHADITKRRLAEDALRDSESRLKEQTLKLEKALQDLQETQTQLIQTEKMSSLGQLVAGIAHEINNPVNFIHGNVNCAHDYIDNLISLLNLYRQTYPQPAPEIIAKSEEIDLEFLLSDLPQLLKSMQVGTERIAKIVLSLRSFSRLDEADRKAVDIHAGIDDTLLILQYNLKAKGNASKVNVIKDYGDLPLVECYAGQLNQVFMNILSNAIDAFPKESENPTIRIKTELNGDRAIISISDNGTGMNSNVQKSLFNPFFTTKPVGQGTGLGLAISYQIVVEKHGGTLQCQSELDKGTEFRIEIPVNATM